MAITVEQFGLIRESTQQALSEIDTDICPAVTQ
jgi:hypothetical protein